MPRKACDVCYRKRIKCDGQKPRCSNCILYSIECTSEAASRKSRPRKQKKATGETLETLQARISSLESNLTEALQKISDLESRDIVEDDSTLFESSSEAGQARPSIAQGDLPPLQDTLLVVEKFLRTLNSILPLFRPQTLLKLIKNWYTGSKGRDTTIWVAINVVLALASREDCAQQTTSSNNMTYYIRNAQGVLTDIIAEETTLLSVQVVVGMALLFQGIQDLKPATVLIAIALRLAHDLGLHTREGSEHLSSSEQLERDRVFWIAYILDRDISMRTRKPPVQRDADIQIPWPAAEPEMDWAGCVIAEDGTSSFNFFQARVRLAQIQGDVYEVMFSPRAVSRYSAQGPEDIAVIEQRLDDWLSKIPQWCQPRAVAKANGSRSLRSFGVLFASHFACRIYLCQAHIMELQWLQSLRHYGTTSIYNGLMVAAPRPQGWNKLVVEARQFVELYNKIERKDPSFLWMTACTYVSAAIILTANNMFSPKHEKFRSDEHQIEVAFSFYLDFVEQAPFETLKTTRAAWEELRGFAHVAQLQSAKRAYST